MMKKLALLVVLLMFIPTGASADHQDFDFRITANDRKVGSFPYEQVLDAFGSRAGWLSGDRVAYRCAYTFLERRRNGELLARVTFTRPEQAKAYVALTDSGMEEGVRFYNGSPTPPGTQQVPDSECPRPTEPYEALVGDPEIPRIVFSNRRTGATFEIRDYTTVATRAEGSWCCDQIADPGHQFAITSATPNRVTVVIYQDRLPVMVVYYDRLSRRVRLTSNFGG